MYREEKYYALAQKLMDSKAAFGFLNHPWIPHSYFVSFRNTDLTKTKIQYSYIRKSNSDDIHHRCDCSDYNYYSLCEHVIAAVWTLKEWSVLNFKTSPYLTTEDKYTLKRDFPQIGSKGFGKTTFRPDKEQIAIFLKMLNDQNFRDELINNLLEESNIIGWKKTIRDLNQSKLLNEKTSGNDSKKRVSELAGKSLLYFCLSPKKNESTNIFSLNVQLLSRRYLNNEELGDLTFFPDNNFFQQMNLDQLEGKLAKPEDKRILKTAFRSSIFMQRYSGGLFLEEEFDLESFLDIFKDFLDTDRFLFFPNSISRYQPIENFKKLQKLKYLSKNILRLKLVAQVSKDQEKLIIEPKLVAIAKNPAERQNNLDDQLTVENDTQMQWPNNDIYPNFCIINSIFYQISINQHQELMNYFLNSQTPSIVMNTSEFHEFYAYYLNTLDWPELEIPLTLRPEEVSMDPTGAVLINLNPNGKFFSYTEGLYYGSVRVDKLNQKSLLFDPQFSKIIRRNYHLENIISNNIDQIMKKYSENIDEARFILMSQLNPAISDLLENKIAIQIDNNKLRTAETKVNVQTSGIDWLDLKLEMNVEGFGPIPPIIILNSLRKRENFIQLSNGDKAFIPIEWIEKYSSLAANSDQNSESIGLSKIQSLLLASDLTDNPQLASNKKIKTLRELIHCLNHLKKVKPSKRFKGTLRDYQQIGLGWLQQILTQELGGILADDMGLGKTIQVLSAIDLCLRDQGPILIVAPKSLIFNWENEASKFTPHLKILNITGNNRNEKLAKIPDNDLILTTYQTLRADIEKIQKISFAAMILDEAQYFKNRQSQVFGACRLVQASKKLALTGTPIENSVDDLFSILEIVIPGLISSKTRKSFLNDAKPDELKNLGKSLKPFILRRTKDEVLTDLPEKIEKTIYCELSKESLSQYNKLKEFYWRKLKEKIETEGMAKARFDILEAMLRLRQLACHPGLISDIEKNKSSDKLDLLLEELTQVIQGRHKVLIFSQFTSLLALVKPQLEKLNIKYEYLDGSTVNRQDRVNNFQNNPDINVFLLSLKAGGVGLNLTSADYVFLLDPWWNPAAESQAIDRTHRIGQSKKVIAYKIVSKGTIEERIIQLQEKKKDLVEAIMNSEGQLKKMTLSDLNLLLS